MQHASLYSQEDRNIPQNDGWIMGNRREMGDRLVPMLPGRGRHQGNKLRAHVDRRVVFVGLELVRRGQRCLDQRRK